MPEPTPAKVLYESFLKSANSIIELYKESNDASNEAIREGYRACLLEFIALYRNKASRMIRTAHPNLSSSYIKGDELLREFLANKQVDIVNFNFPRNNHPRQPFYNSPSENNLELKRKLRLSSDDSEGNPFENELFKKSRLFRRKRDEDSDSF